MKRVLSFRSLHWKILLVCVVVVFVPLYLLNQYTIRFFDKFTRVELEKHLVDSAYMAGQLFADHLESPESPPAKVAFNRLKQFGIEIEADIHILDVSGVVLYTSGAPEEIGRDLSYRPEVQDALKGGYSARSMLTEDRRFMFYYCARPIKTSTGRVVGVAYVYRHTGPIVYAINQMVVKQRTTTAISLSVAALLSLLLGLTITRRLRRLSSASAAFARDKKPMTIKVGGGDEITDLAHSFVRMSEEITRQNLYSRDFINTLMHELKMPLTAIKGAAELLEQGAAEKPQAREKFLSNIRYEIDRMNRMVAELNELSKLDIEDLQGHREPLEYGTFVKGVCGRFMPASEPHAELKVSVPGQPMIVEIMPDRLEQVLTNLLDNAFRYTPAGGAVTVLVSETEDGIETVVSDSGSGISESNIEKIFERFFTTEPKNVPKDYGSGLGLAIAKTIVENHNGRIHVESIAGQGATFRFILPCSVR